MNKNTGTYPWQERLWQQLNEGRQKLHHAFLMYGRAGIGKYDFAMQFSKALLCHHVRTDGHACGECPSCRWFNDESHPDFRLLSPEQESSGEDESVSAKKTKKKTQISVAQIRELSDFLGLSSHQTQGLRVILIHPAEALNLASANALLKMLEEPAPGVIFILVAHQVQRLLPTILSRCHKISMPVPEPSQALAWLNTQNVKDAEQQLAYFEGSPIKVLSEQEQFDQLPQIWKLLALGRRMESQALAPLLLAHSAENGVLTMQKWLYDMLVVKLGLPPKYHLQQARALQALSEKVNLGRLFELQKKTNELRRLATHPLNHELQLETLLSEYSRAFQA